MEKAKAEAASARARGASTEEVDKADKLAEALELAAKEVAPTEKRAMSLEQLLDIRNVIDETCEKEGWHSTDPQKDERLVPGRVTLYDLNQLYLLKVTGKRRCSYVTLVASGPQPPKWFVSHWCAAHRPS